MRKRDNNYHLGGGGTRFLNLQCLCIIASSCSLQHHHMRHSLTLQICGSFVSRYSHEVSESTTTITFNQKSLNYLHVTILLYSSRMQGTNLFFLDCLLLYRTSNRCSILLVVKSLLVADVNSPQHSQRNKMSLLLINIFAYQALTSL
jgi:hypothetical protein